MHKTPQKRQNKTNDNRLNYDYHKVSTICLIHSPKGVICWQYLTNLDDWLWISRFNFAICQYSFQLIHNPEMFHVERDWSFLVSRGTL